MTATETKKKLIFVEMRSKNERVLKKPRRVWGPWFAVAEVLDDTIGLILANGLRRHFAVGSIETRIVRRRVGLVR